MYMYILNEDMQQPELATKINSNGKVHCEHVVITSTANPLPERAQITWSDLVPARGGRWPSL